jgi:hypothetical protein
MFLQVGIIKKFNPCQKFIIIIVEKLYVGGGVSPFN